MDFHNVSLTTSRDNAKVRGARISCRTFVLLPQYGVPFKNLRHKSNTFHATLAPCTCICR